MALLHQIHSDIRDRFFESKGQEIESAEKASRLHFRLMLGSVFTIILLVVGFLTLALYLPGNLAGPIIVPLILIFLFGGMGFVLWRLSRK